MITCCEKKQNVEQERELSRYITGDGYNEAEQSCVTEKNKEGKKHDTNQTKLIIKVI